jgi:glycosyltransferase involved in cell wall biosynthesis
MAALQAFALAAASDPRLRYVVVGDGPERTALEAAVSRLGLSDRVTLVGALPREQVAAHLQAADAFLFLSHHLEGLPLNILEALAVGLPVVLSGHLAQNLGITERLWPVDPRNPGAIARALSAALVVGPATEGLLPEQFTLSHAVRAYRALFDALRSGERH